MNSIRSKLSTFAFCSLQRKHCDTFMSLSVQFKNVSRRFSSEEGSDETDKKGEIYIPRRIKRRMKEKNMNVEEFEITPVYTDKFKHKSSESEKTLADSIVDTEINAEFPSDLEMTNKIFKDVEPVKTQVTGPKVNPRDTSVLLFPGQGSQIVGMGKKVLPYPGVKELYEKASDILGYDILSLCLNGPKRDLDKTVHCQPALFVTSLAAIERLKEEFPEVNCINNLLMC